MHNIKQWLSGEAAFAVGHREQLILHIAAWTGDVDVVRHQIQQGQDVAASDKFGWTALHFAAWNMHADVVKVLLHSTANIRSRGIWMRPKQKKPITNPIVNAKNQYGWSALHLAAWNDDIIVINALVQAGATISARDIRGWTPTHWAASNGAVAAIMALAQAGADVSSAAQAGVVPLHLAAKAGHVNAIESLKRRA